MSTDTAMLDSSEDAAYVYDLHSTLLSFGCLLARQGAPLATVPTTLKPSILSRNIYNQVESLTPLFNRLYHSVSEDFDYLLSILSPIASVDPFIGRLIQVATQVKQEGKQQKYRMAVSRSDYMLDTSGPHVRAIQVEFNAIAAGLVSLSTRVARAHQYMRERYESTEKDLAPENNALEQVASSIAHAHSLYLSSSPVRPSVCVLFVVQPNEWNRCDQEILKLQLWQQHKVGVVRKTFEQLHRDCLLDASTGELLVDGRTRVSVIYYRSGYSPNDFAQQPEQKWATLLMLERSLAIKCPNVFFHLSGTKAVQQALTKPGALERFVNEQDAARLRETFTDIFCLSESSFPQHGVASLSSLISLVISSPGGFVLKPQREGGGNNVWDQQEIERILNEGKQDPARLASYILMRRIIPPEFPCVSMRDGACASFTATSELGFFGSLVADQGTIIHNATSGYLLRTKRASSVEGGISQGSGFIDSIKWDNK